MNRVSRAPIDPNRVRAIRGQSFAWLPHRFLRDGFFAALTADERSLYLFLVLAADRSGLSWYGYDKICAILEVTLEQYIAARDALIDKHLVAFDGLRFQVLDLPDRPTQVQPAALTRDSMDDHDPASIRRILVEDLLPASKPRK
jgi:hypothetical protein